MSVASLMMPSAFRMLTTLSLFRASLLILAFGAYSSRFPTMANGGSRRGLYGEGRRTAVAAETHSPPHVQRGQAGSQRGRPIGRATHRKSDPSEERPIGKGDPSEGRPIGRLEGYNFRWEG